MSHLPHAKWFGAAKTFCWSSFANRLSLIECVHRITEYISRCCYYYYLLYSMHIVVSWWQFIKSESTKNKTKAQFLQMISKWNFSLLSLHTQQARTRKCISQLAISFGGLFDIFEGGLKTDKRNFIHSFISSFYCSTRKHTNTNKKKQSKKDMQIYLMLTILEMLLCYLNRCQTVDKGPNHSIRLECDGWCCFLTSWIQLFFVSMSSIVVYLMKLSTEGNGKWRCFTRVLCKILKLYDQLMNRVC